VEALAARLGQASVVEACGALLDGAPPETCTEVAVGLTGHGRTIEELRESGFRDYWWPTWGARGLLYVWSPKVAPAVVRGIAHEHWRPAEMCLKVAARRELAEAADSAVPLASHDLPRVRASALRTLGRVGDTEHVPPVRSALGDTDSQVRRAAALALERMVARLDLPGGVLP
jgi:HEAT repeat protein